MKTLKEAIKIFNEWADNHPSIEQFVFDNINNVTLKDRDINYPVMWVVALPSNVNTLSFDIYFMELLSVDRVNLLDCMSEMNTLVYDFVRHFEGVYKISDARITPFEGRFDDYVAGVVLNITFDFWNINTCNNG